MELEVAKKKVEEVKKALKTQVDGKYMIRQDRSYKGLEKDGVYTFSVYYDVPTPTNTEAVRRVVLEHGFAITGKMRVIGGTYGYTLMFRTK